MGIYIMVQRKELRDIADQFEGKKEKPVKQNAVNRKTTKEHLSDFADNPKRK